jgi:hypothetical protein
MKTKELLATNKALALQKQKFVIPLQKSTIFFGITIAIVSVNTNLQQGIIKATNIIFFLKYFL